MKPAAFPVLRATRLLDQVRERIRYKHYSLRTEQTYVQWVKLFVKWHGLRYPGDMGQPEIEAYLSMLANQRRVAACTHNQALSALLFLYREVLHIDLPWLDDIQRPRTPKGDGNCKRTTFRRLSLRPRIRSGVAAPAIHGPNCMDAGSSPA